ncbi:hypothetical protein NKH77_07295 [Streptomyces sp. M19]
MAKAAISGHHSAPWGLFAITRAEDGTALGGIGFHGPPGGARWRSATTWSPRRGRGLGHRRAAAAAGVDAGPAAGRHRRGSRRAGERPSQRVLARTGFRRVADRGPLRAYELRAVHG